MQQAIESVVGLMMNQARAKAQPHARPIPLPKRKPQPQEEMEASIQNFPKVNLPTFSKNLMVEDPYIFLDKTSKAIQILR